MRGRSRRRSAGNAFACSIHLACLTMWQSGLHMRAMAGQFLKPCIARPQTNSQCQQPLRESNSRMVTVTCQLQRQLCCDRIRTVNQSTPGVFLTCQSWTGRSPIVRATATPEYVTPERLSVQRLAVTFITCFRTSIAATCRHYSLSH